MLADGLIEDAARRLARARRLAVLTGAMAQPAGHTDLSTLTLRLLFIGE